MSYEHRKFAIHCYFGRFFHIEKIVELLDKKYDVIVTEDQIKDLVEAVDSFIQSYKE